MDLSRLLKYYCYWLATIAGTGNTPIWFDGDVLDAIAGETFLVKTWADTHQLKSITVSTDNGIRLMTLFIKSNRIISKDHRGVILLQYNNNTKEMSMILENFSKEDEGIYYVDEIVSNTNPNDFEREAGEWNFKLNVVEPSEIVNGDAGGIFTMEIRNTSILHNLYYYDHIVANLMLCDAELYSPLHGRLQCRKDLTKYIIIIQKVTQRDIGLYTVGNSNNGNNMDNKRYYLNVTDQTTDAIIGENVNIDWFYSQQAINRSLRIIHSNNGIMMILPPSNKPQVVTAFRNRLVYSGNVSRCYMSFTLLHIGKSDSGVFKIETIHGNTVYGCKHIIVKGTITDSTSTKAPSLVTFGEILDTEEYATSPSVTVQRTFSANPIITQSHRYISDEIIDIQDETLHVQQHNLFSDSLMGTTTRICILFDAIGVPTYVVIPVVILTIVTIMMLAYVIWIQHNRLAITEADRLNLLKYRDHELYITPIEDEIQPPIPLMNDEHASDPRTTQCDTNRLILHANQNMCMDGYDMIACSSNDAAKRVCNNNETGYFPTECINKHAHDNFGYLTVLGVLETSV